MNENIYINKKTKRDENINNDKKSKKVNIIKEKEKINNNIKEEIKKENKYNIIIGNIKVKKGNLKQRIINSFENFKSEIPNWNILTSKAKENEEEIKKCEIYINDKKINFTFIMNF